MMDNCEDHLEDKYNQLRHNLDCVVLTEEECVDHNVTVHLFVLCLHQVVVQVGNTIVDPLDWVDFASDVYEALIGIFVQLLQVRESLTFLNFIHDRTFTEQCSLARKYDLTFVSDPNYLSDCLGHGRLDAAVIDKVIYNLVVWLEQLR